MPTLLAVLAAALWAQEPLPPEETARRLKLPEGFSARLFAGEPDVVQPVSFALDDRGRLWVAEMLSYPRWNAKDRVTILEDADGDGRFDKRTLFYEGLTYVTGIEVGFGGLWVVTPPTMQFIPDRDGDDKPDGPPVVLLDGFGTHGGHNIVNGFTWGPDGWLYAGHGRTSISDVGKPGVRASERIHFDGGVWRYHPTRHVFEAWCDGTTNPWGVSFDDHGQMFITTCVDAHLYHALQGAHHEPWRGRESSRFAYKRVPTIADHLHWVGRGYGRGENAEILAAGGGHAHCGVMVYLGDSFPEAYRGSVFMSNLHGHRLNNDLVARKGSGFTARHGKDFLLSPDPMFLGITIQYGPDGSVFVSDWYDRGECHTRSPHDRSGRIYKVIYKDQPAAKVDLARLSDEELVRLQLHRNEWHVTHARRLLQERGPNPRVHEALLRILDGNPDVTRKLRALWALHATGGLTDERRARLLESPEEYLRGWAIQLELEDRKAPPAVVERYAAMAELDPSPVVRLYLAAGGQRLSPAERWPVVERLAARAEDVDDPNLPLMVWYAAEPAIAQDVSRGIALVRKSRIPLLREFAARRVAALAEPKKEAAPELEGTIAFSSLAPRGWDLYLTDRETGKTTRLTDHPGLDYNAAFSPDGNRIAFVSERDGNPEIYTIGVDGQDLRRVTAEFALDDRPSWSPDAGAILFTSTRHPASPGRPWNALYVMGADGSGAERISPLDAADLSPAWSPWGDMIACASGGDVYVMRADGSERKRVAPDGGWPTFAPRSRSQLYFHSRREGKWGIWTVNTSGTGIARVTPPDVEAFTPAAAATAKVMAVAVKRGKFRQVEAMDLATRAMTPVTTGEADHWNPTISHDGRYVVYHKASPAAAPNVEAWSAPGGTRLSMLRVGGSFPAFSPDGRRIALAGEGFSRVDVMNADGSERKTLFSGKRRSVFSLSWSRRDEWIAFSNGEVFQGAGTEVSLGLVRPDGTDLRQVAGGSANTAFPSFGPEGDRLVCRSGRGGAKNLYVLLRDGTEVRRLTEGNWTDTMCDWSPAGDGVVFSSNRGGAFEVWLVKPDGAGLRKLVTGGTRNNHPHFSPDGRWVVFTSDRAGLSAEEIAFPSQPQPYGELFAVRVDGSALVRLTHNAWEDGTPAWGSSRP